MWPECVFLTFRRQEIRSNWKSLTKKQNKKKIIFDLLVWFIGDFELISNQQVTFCKNQP